MFSIKKSVLPANAMLTKYNRNNGAYTDCYSTEIAGQVSLPQFVFAFYTTFLFKLERFILTWTVSKPATDLQAKQLTENLIQSFAAWNVENRSEKELLMCDFAGRTRSWFMVENFTVGNENQTRLYFGSAVVPKDGDVSLDFGFKALLGFHRLYSILLLSFAKARVKHQLS